jgi:hypothetical protein
MVALTSPGLSITVTDETQYISTAVGTVPLVILATAQDKTVNGSYADGTSKANAGALQVFGSQRELTAALGYPIFQQSAAGTPLHGNELNEYGLMASYSSLGMGNRLYAIRADIDLNDLIPTTVRPQGKVPDQTKWFDLADSSWGIYEWNSTTQTFVNKLPIVITSTNDIVLANYGNSLLTNTLTSEPTPRASIGQIGSYAIVATTINNRLFYKNWYNQWTLVGDVGTPSAGNYSWQHSWPTVLSGVITGGSLNVSPVTNSTFTGTSITLNTVTISISAGSTLSQMVTAINSSAIGMNNGGPVAAWATSDNRLAISCNSLSKSNGSTVDGKLAITSSTLVTELGGSLTAGTYNCVKLQYGDSVAVPGWQSSVSTKTASGSVWLKIGVKGNGANFVFQTYNALADIFTKQSSLFFTNEPAAIVGLSTTGGSNIGVGTIYIDQDPPTDFPVWIDREYASGSLVVYSGTIYLATAKILKGSAAPGSNVNWSSQGAENADGNGQQYSGGYAGFRPMIRKVFGAVTVYGNAVYPTFTSGNQFLIRATQPGVSTLTSNVITISGTSYTDFVAAVLAANIPYVTAQVESNGTISFTHQRGGTIYLSPVVGQGDPLTTAGFPVTSGVVNHMRINGTTRILSGFDILSYTYSFITPYADPAAGKLWFSSDTTNVDIMINDGTYWRGYKNLSNDARGYNLSLTDLNGPIVSASSPTTESDGSDLVAGDIWLDTSDLENWPKLSRWDGLQWVSIDNTDQTSQNGILFADARWDDSGTTDPVAASLIGISVLDSSDYLDLDAPNPALYPKGMLLFNTRRSGYNVKRWVGNYFNKTTFSVVQWTDKNYSQGNKVLYGTTLYVAVASITQGSGAPNINLGWNVLQNGAWVTASGLKPDGSMYAGHQAQRRSVVAAMQSAISANTQIREDQFKFNLIVAPGYPELIDEMVALSNDRANTAFVIGDTPLTLRANVVDLTNWSNDTDGTGLATSSPYLAVYYPSALSSDAQGNEIMVPPSHMALRAYMYNDNVSYPWFAPAGTRRGLIDNATDLGYLSTVTGEFVRTGVSRSLRDSLYELNINPITIMPGVGLVVFGQKTRNPTASALDRVNVARLVNYIRTILATSGNAFLFEPNDKITRDQFKQVIEGAMNDLVSKRGIYDYLVVCDTSNNTPDRIARNELYVDIAISPMRDVEFIYIPIRLVNPGVIGSLGK